MELGGEFDEIDHLLYGTVPFPAQVVEVLPTAIETTLDLGFHLPTISNYALRCREGALLSGTLT